VKTYNSQNIDQFNVIDEIGEALGMFISVKQEIPSTLFNHPPVSLSHTSRFAISPHKSTSLSSLAPLGLTILGDQGRQGMMLLCQ